MPVFMKNISFSPTQKWLNWKPFPVCCTIFFFGSLRLVPTKPKAGSGAWSGESGFGSRSNISWHEWRYFFYFYFHFFLLFNCGAITFFAALRRRGIERCERRRGRRETSAGRGLHPRRGAPVPCPPVLGEGAGAPRQVTSKLVTIPYVSKCTFTNKQFNAKKNTVKFLTVILKFWCKSNKNPSILKEINIFDPKITCFTIWSHALTELNSSARESMGMVCNR